MENMYQINEVKLTYKSKTDIFKQPKIMDSNSVFKLLLNCFDNETIDYRESFKVVLLNRSNTVLGVMNVAEGGISGVMVDIRMIMQAAILSNASGIAVAHNHPSGNINPSGDDDIITRKIKEACRIMQIAFLDHLIISSESYYSYADNGMIY